MLRDQTTCRGLICTSRRVQASQLNLTSFHTTLFARALFDNTAESEDELAFCKGDIIMVHERNVLGSTGWWKCSVHGRKGLAPANRLGHVSLPQAETLCPDFSTDCDPMGKQRNKNIYQIPKPAMVSPVDPIYEDMNMIYKLSSPHIPSADKHMSQEDQEGTGSPCDACKVASLASQDPNYDILLPSISEDSQKHQIGCSTMPKPSKSEWIYDVPVLLQKQGHYETMPPKTMNLNKPLYDVVPTRVWPKSKDTLTQPLYDIPKPSSAVQTSVDTDSSIYDVPPCLKRTETPALPKQHSVPEKDSNNSFETLEGFRSCEKVQYWRSRNQTLPRLPVRRHHDDSKDNQRSSTLSTSSTASSSSRSSCDSFLLSSPEPEPIREIMLSQEEVGQRLLELQDAVCQSVPKLMLFVSSQWRIKEHLGQHLQQIRLATEEVTDSITCFINFALDVRGNAQRLTDYNLQARLLKQLSIVEDSGLILQQAADALRDTDWLLEALAQDGVHLQTPDHLERFVMVTRTVPEDVKRLVSILNANGKLLFRTPVKELDMMEQTGFPQKRISSKCETTVDSGIDDSDYVQLQSPSPCSPPQTSKKPSISDHCRLYFGAIQKAISVFLSSLNNGEPPEKFISDSKLVIMVGQRLVNSLCSESKGREASRDMLSMSNQLCAHLKQLAMVTKKAALEFPDKTALQEAQDTAKELAHRAQHFRMSLDV
ncbi:Cas scaffolding protein family member 4 [Triplophysa tibetana]|uniref:Cas scaffolding protein family member 4 n=1 Tax=Triplophysa tibetana TaxID=1572043 RepID=A0A5A9NE53_9TELE|nr:Cas scaffolding protein family member 4 [Triplophysa tibetana]